MSPITLPGIVDTSFVKYKKVDIFRTFGMLLDSLYFFEEATQVHGTVSVVDFTNGTMALQRAVTLQERKDFFQTWEVGVLLNNIR